MTKEIVTVPMAAEGPAETVRAYLTYRAQLHRAAADETPDAVVDSAALLTFEHGPPPGDLVRLAAQLARVAPDRPLLASPANLIAAPFLADGPADGDEIEAQLKEWERAWARTGLVLETPFTDFVLLAAAATDRPLTDGFLVGRTAEGWRDLSLAVRQGIRPSAMGLLTLLSHYRPEALIELTDAVTAEHWQRVDRRERTDAALIARLAPVEFTPHIDLMDRHADALERAGLTSAARHGAALSLAALLEPDPDFLADDTAQFAQALRESNRPPAFIQQGALSLSLLARAVGMYASVARIVIAQATVRDWQRQVAASVPVCRPFV